LAVLLEAGGFVPVLDDFEPVEEETTGLGPPVLLLLLGRTTMAAGGASHS
jgi:hypothetical protein